MSSYPAREESIRLTVTLEEKQLKFWKDFRLSEFDRITMVGTGSSDHLLVHDGMGICSSSSFKESITHNPVFLTSNLHHRG